MRIKYLVVAALAICSQVHSQQRWTIEECISYAVANNHSVRQVELEYDNYRSEHNAAIAAFAPSINGYSSLQFSTGRTTSNETNNYINVSSMTNAYSIEATLPLFNGGNLFNSLRSAAQRKAMGASALRKAQDNMAIDVMQSCIEVLYYKGLIGVSTDKLAESDSVFRKANRMMELGMKSQSDVAQIAAQNAADRYDLTHNTNLYRASMLKLKQQMTLQTSDTLELDTTKMSMINIRNQSADEIFAFASKENSSVKEVLSTKNAARYSRYAAIGSMLPSLNLYAGINTSYQKIISNSEASTTSFSKQLDNNLGQYVGVQLSVPLLGNLRKTGAARRARNQMLIATEKYYEALDQLRADVEQAVLDCDAYTLEIMQMQTKVDADILAYQLTKRKFEEGLMNAIDLQNSANTLALSKAKLLQSRLTLMLKLKYLNYLQGEKLY